jgi:glycosyltransferase involved in cell wall biosynthesis
VKTPKALFLANTDWYLWNFRLPLLRALRDRGWEVVLASPRGPWSERFAAEGLRWVPFEFARHGVNPLAEAGVLGKLFGLYRRERPDLVHHFTIKCVLYGSFAAHRARVPVIVNAVTGRGTMFTTHSILARLLRAPLRSLYRRALRGSRVIFQNPDDRGEFEAEGLLADAEVHVIRGSGIDVDRFSPSPAPASESPIVVILVARLLREKGIAEFVEAAQMLQGARARFLLVGGPDPEHPAAIDTTTLAQWKARGNVEFLGHRDDVLELLHSAHIACLPSWREGTPRSLLEAMACGLPIVATDVPGCREVVRNGDNGLLVPPRDPQALADALRRLINDPELRTSMGARSRQRAVDEFSAEHVIERTMAVYEAAR